MRRSFLHPKDHQRGKRADSGVSHAKKNIAVPEATVVYFSFLFFLVSEQMIVIHAPGAFFKQCHLFSFSFLRQSEGVVAMCV